MKASGRAARRPVRKLGRRCETHEITGVFVWRIRRERLAVYGACLHRGASVPRFQARGTKARAGVVTRGDREMSDKDNKGSMTVAEAGRKGGETVRNERGREFYETIGRKGGATVKAERGRSFYEEIGRKGGETVKAERGAKFYEEIGKKGGDRVKATRGPNFYEEIGRKGGQKVKKLIEEGKRAARAAMAAQEGAALICRPTSAR